MPKRLFLTVATVLGALAAAPLPASWAQSAPSTANWTAEQDHRNMMEQLGITALRPGPNGDENAPDHANYGVWKYKTDHAYNTWVISYDGGWAKQTRGTLPGPNKTVPPDRPPSLVFEAFPKTFDLPWNYANPVTGK
jgi:hypothetical protein